MKYNVFYYLKNVNNVQLLLIKIVSILRLFFISFIFSFILFSNSKATEIIVNNTVPNQHYSLNTIRAIFVMRMTTWKNGQHIKVFVLPDNHPTHQAFTKNKLAMFPHQLRSFWNRLVDSGTGKSPTEVNSLAQMLQSVATTPYAIGYVENRASANANIRSLEY